MDNKPYPEQNPNSEWFLEDLYGISVNRKFEA